MCRIEPQAESQRTETYSADQLVLVLQAAPAGWARLAILILLGTGMRVSELCRLIVEDVEDDGAAAFLKVRRGKGRSSGGCRLAAASDASCSAT